VHLHYPQSFCARSQGSILLGMSVAQSRLAINLKFAVAGSQSLRTKVLSRRGYLKSRSCDGAAPSAVRAYVASSVGLETDLCVGMAGASSD
jgi:hypothetical protein